MNYNVKFKCLLILQWQLKFYMSFCTDQPADSSTSLWGQDSSSSGPIVSASQYWGWCCSHCASSQWKWGRGKWGWDIIWHCRWKSWTCSYRQVSYSATLGPSYFLVSSIRWMVPCVSFPTKLQLPMSFVPMPCFCFPHVFTYGSYNMFLSLPQV